MKKVIKKKTTKSTKATTVKKSTSAPAHREGYSHSNTLSNNALMGIAVFFALVGLFVVMMYQKQQMEYEQYQRAHAQESMNYLTRPATTATPKTKMMKY